MDLSLCKRHLKMFDQAALQNASICALNVNGIIVREMWPINTILWLKYQPIAITTIAARLKSLS